MALSGRFNRLLDGWLRRRIPAGTTQVLNQRSLFVFPTPAGFGFLATAIVVWLLGINYQNNLVLVVSYLMLSLLVLSIVHAYLNLAGIQISFVQGHNAFPGEGAEFELNLVSLAAREHSALRLCFEGGTWQSLDQLAAERQRLKIYRQAERRGRLRPGRLRIESDYPLGLIRAWSLLDLNAQALVYPAPVNGPVHFTGTGSDSEGRLRPQPGTEEFSGFQAYQPGMELKRMAWKHYARGQGLHIKEFLDQPSGGATLDWFAQEGEIEQRCSYLCAAIIRLCSENQPVALTLPEQQFAADTGAEHKLRLLSALALVGQTRGLD